MVKPVDAADVLLREREALRPNGEGERLTALCISGGGIRSATFGLGVIQGLAERGLLQQFDYLSTVSGGGYIGGWLTAWAKRIGLDGVVRRLASHARPSNGERDPIQHLREYNNYLAPAVGGLSSDLWTLLAATIRNIILNWLVLIPLALALLLVPRLYLSVLALPERLFPWLLLPGRDYAAPALNAISHSPFVYPTLPFASLTLFTIGLFNTLRYLPGVGGKLHTRADYGVAILAPIIGAVLTFLAFDSLYYYGDRYLDYSSVGPLILWVSRSSALAWILFFATDRRPLRQRLRLMLSPLPLAIVAMGIGVGVSTWAITNFLLWNGAGVGPSWATYVTVGPPAMLVGVNFGTALFAGLSSGILKDEDREWLARSSAGVVLACVAWVALSSVVLILPSVVLEFHARGMSVVAVGGAISALLSRLSPPKAARPNAKSRRPTTQLALGLAVEIAPVAFVALLAIALSIFTNVMLRGLDALLGSPGGFGWHDHADVLGRTNFTSIIGLFGAFLVLSWVMGRFININTFSLHGVYRDRLVRAYLGASNPARRPNRFTDFDPLDDMPMVDLRRQRPIHLVNVTLNLVLADRLAWQERKAASFTVTSFHCGSAETGYRDSAGYAGGLSLGTAIALSGAAASPNMGYYSSPIAALILTLFNARLGAWLGNPGVAGEHTWKASGPRSASLSLAAEALGLTSERNPYVYLSDGGHFENLGLYEVVRRRCHSVVVVDSASDPDFALGDLGNALRKIRLDFGVSIEFDSAKLRALTNRKCRFAVAAIRYSEVDPSVPDGTLVYVKPMLLGVEPADVSSYAAAHPEFPHQSTADQWFDESQTESYRQLGLITIREMCGAFEREAAGDLREVCERLRAPQPE